MKPVDSGPGTVSGLAGTGIGAEGRRDPSRGQVNLVGSGALPHQRAPLVTRRLTLDREKLRKDGLLPALSQERQFGDYYRRIKRPVIAQALAQTAGGAIDLRLVMVASALPGDGKTFTSFNLALSIAREQDVSVVLVDADTAKLRLSRILGVERMPGLLDAIVDPALDVESRILSTNIPGLRILPAGRQHESATELLASARMTQVVGRIIASDPRCLVLFDSPPLLPSSESRALVQLLGQVVLVVRSGVTPQRAVLEAISCIPENKPVGLILNGRVADLTDKYYGYGAYYEKID